MISDRTKNLLNRIDEAKALIDKHRPLPKAVVSRLREEMLIEWTYNSNGIEGNTLTLRETKLAILEGITVRNKSLTEYLEAINHKDAIAFVEELAGAKNKITERNIREIHSLVLKEIDSDYAGKYRDMNVRISGSSHTPPDSMKIKELMSKFAKKKINSKEHPIVEAARAHYELVSIHPFVDGNGRTARLLMNLILIKNGYFPAVILKNDRLKYYDVLEKGREAKLDEFVFFVARSLERTIYLYIEAIPKIKDSLITLKEASEISSYSTDYLNIMARRGTIPTFKIKRNWMVSKKAFKSYLKSREKK